MPNHLHLLIELKEGITISDIMHDLNSNYTKYFNAKYNQKGHLFQERSRTILAEKASFLLPMTAYIHLNPLAENLVSEVKDYVYSSFRTYIKESNENLVSTADLSEVCVLFKEKSYADFLSNIPKNEMALLGKELAKKLILGPEGFVAKVGEMMEKTVSENQAPKTNQKKLVFAASAAMVLLGTLTFYIYGSSLRLKDALKKDLENKEIELSQRLKKERTFIYKDLDEKYRADQVSYKAMAKRLEIEKNKVKELEEKSR